MDGELTHFERNAYHGFWKGRGCGERAVEAPLRLLARTVGAGGGRFGLLLLSRAGQLSGADRGSSALVCGDNRRSGAVQGRGYFWLGLGIALVLLSCVSLFG